MTTPVSRSSQALYNVNSRVTTSVSLSYNVKVPVSPVKMLSALYNVMSPVSRSVGLSYSVQVPVSPPKSTQLTYNVLSPVSAACSLVYNVQVLGTSKVTKSVQIAYHTLVKPLVSGVITQSIQPDSVPPQVVTTTSL